MELEQGTALPEVDTATARAPAKKSFLPSWLLESKASLHNFKQTVKTTQAGLKALGKNIDSFNSTIEESRARAAEEAIRRAKPKGPQLSYLGDCPPEIWEVLLQYLDFQSILNVSLVEKRVREVIAEDQAWQGYALARWKGSFEDLPLLRQPRTLRHPGACFSCIYREHALHQAVQVLSKIGAAREWHQMPLVSQRSQAKWALCDIIRLSSNDLDHTTRSVLAKDNVVFGMMRLIQNESDVLPPFVSAAVANLVAGPSDAAAYCRKMVLKIGLDRKLVQLLSSSSITCASLTAKEASKALSHIYLPQHSFATLGSIYSTQTGLQEGRTTLCQLLTHQRDFPTPDTGNSLYLSLMGVQAAAGTDKERSMNKSLSFFKLYHRNPEDSESEEGSSPGVLTHLPLSRLVSPDGLRYGRPLHDWLKYLRTWRVWRLLRFTSGGSLKEEQPVAVRCTARGTLVGRGTDTTGPFTLHGTLSSVTHSMSAEEKAETEAVERLPQVQLSAHWYYLYQGQQANVASDWQMQVLEEPGPLALARGATDPVQAAPGQEDAKEEELAQLYDSDTTVDAFVPGSFKGHESFTLYGELPTNGFWGLWELFTVVTPPSSSSSQATRVSSRGVCRLLPDAQGLRFLQFHKTNGVEFLGAKERHEKTASIDFASENIIHLNYWNC